MSKVKKCLCLMLCFLFIAACIPNVTVEAAVAKNQGIIEVWVQGAELPVGSKWNEDNRFGSSGYKANYANMSVHFLNDGDGSAHAKNAIYCLAKNIQAESSVATLAISDDFKNTAYWKTKLTPQAQRGITLVSLYSKPHNSSNLGVEDILSWEMIYAAQILIWEFTTQTRTNFTQAQDEYWSYAFKSNTGASGYSKMHKTDVAKAKEYYNALVKACANHTSVQIVDEKSFTATKLGKTTFTNAAFEGCSVKSDNTDNVTASISGKVLTVDVKKGYKTKLHLTKDITVVSKSSDYVPVMVNAESHGQQLMYGAISDPQEADIYIDASSLTGAWKITKTDENSKALPNIVFGRMSDSAGKKIYTNSDGEWVVSITDSSGKITSSSIYAAGQTYYFREIGWYDSSNKEFHINQRVLDSTNYNKQKLSKETSTTTVVKESSNAITEDMVETTGRKYRINFSTGSVTIVADKTTDVKFDGETTLQNTEMFGSVGVIKQDSEGNPLQGAKFGVYSSSSCTDSTLLDTVTSDKFGRVLYGGRKKAEFSLIPGNTYYFKELEAPAGYIKSTEVLSAKVVENRITYAKANGAARGSTFIYRTYQNETINSSHGVVRVIYTDTSGNYITGVKVKLFSTYEDALAGTNAEKTLTTASDTLVFAGTGTNLETSTLATGNHYVKVGKMIYPVTVYKNGYSSLYLRSGSEVRNEKAGALTIHKYRQLSNGTKMNQEDFTFNVYSNSACTTKVATIVTDSTGTATYGVDSKGNYTLKPGTTYYFKESATQKATVNGIILDTTTVYSAKVVAATLVAAKDSEGNTPVNNTNTKGGIGVMKTDENGNRLSGVSFGVYSSKANAESDTSRIATMVTDSTGVAYYGGTDLETFSLNKNAKYYVKEVATVKGHTIDTNIYPVTVAAARVTFVVNNDTTQSTYIRYNTSFSSVQNSSCGSITVISSIDNDNEINGVSIGVFTSLADAKSKTKATANYTVKTSTNTDGNDGYGYFLGSGVIGEELSLSTLAPGDYYLKVTDVPSGFKCTNNIIKVKVYPNVNTIIKINTSTPVVNYIKGGIGVIKTDTDGKPLSGVTFGIYSEADCINLLGTMKTNSNGIGNYGGNNLSSYTLKAGEKYYIKETATVEGYILDDTVRTVTVVGGKTVYVNDKDYLEHKTYPLDYNEQYGALKIVHQNVSGSTFKIYSDANKETLVATITTNSSGEATYYGTGTSFQTSKMNPGTYYVQQITTGNSAKKILQPTFTVDITANVFSTLYLASGTEITNTKYGGAAVRKTTDLGKALGNSTFKLYKDKDCATTAIASGTTNSNGFTYLKATGSSEVFSIVPGTYYLKETETDSTHIVDPTVRKIEISEAKVTFEDSETKMYYTTSTGSHYHINENSGGSDVYSVYSNSECTGTKVAESKALTPGNTYYIKQTAPTGASPVVVSFVAEANKTLNYDIFSNTSVINATKPGNVNLYKLSEKIDGSLVAGIGFTFKLSGTASDGTDVNITKKTVSKTVGGKAYGCASWTDVPVGTYNITEVSDSATKPYKNLLQATVTVEPNTTVTVSDFSAGKTVNENGITIGINEIKKGALKIVKTTSDGEISGWEFTVSCSATGYSKTVYTGSDGTVTLKNLPLATDGSAVNYIVTETMNRKISDSVTDVSSLYKCTSANPQTKSVSGNSEATPVLYSFNNTKYDTSYIYKEDTKGNPVGGAGFTIYSDNTCKIVVLVTDLTDAATGQVIIDTSALTLGNTYYIKETTVPAGYKGDTSVKSFKFDGPVGVTFTNTKLGYIKVNKFYTYNATKYPLESVVFKVYSTIANAQANTSALATITTNSSGVAYYGKDGDYGKLVPGEKYYIREMSVSDEFIAFDSTTYEGHIFTVTVSEDDICTELDVENTLNGAIRIRKFDENKKTGLGGATLSLYGTLSDAQNKKNAIASEVSASSGLVTFGTDGTVTYKNYRLAPGTYYIRETSAPIGYQLSDAILTATVTAGTITNYTTFAQGYTNIQFGGIKIVKTDDENVPLAGCVFEIATDNAFTSPIILPATDEDGFSYYGYDTDHFTLTPGTKYYVREKSCPEGYEKSTEIKTVTVASGVYTATDTFINNKIKTGSLLINKSCVDGGGDWEFTVTGIEGTPTEGISITKKTTADGIDKTKGTVLFEDLLIGEYIVTEKDYPNYIKVTISNQIITAGNITTVSVTNVPKTGKLQINKTVDVGTKKDWKFRVVGVSGGETIYDKIHSTDSTGKILITELRLGTYTVTELAEKDQINKGYYCSGSSAKTIEVKWDGESGYTVPKVTFNNIQRKYTIYKVDMYGEKMKGVKFGVYTSLADANSDTNRVTTLVTDENGYAVYKGFGKAHYYIKEVETFENYMLSPVVLEIDNSSGDWTNSSSAYDAKVVNYISIIATGVSSITDGIGVVALIGLGGGAAYVFLKKKKKKDDED